jgi:hypothetical protein
MQTAAKARALYTHPERCGHASFVAHLIRQTLLGDHALLRKIALNFARANTTLKASLKGKRKSAAWDNDFMATLIAG